MPSPFPGMDPYLEGHQVWPDLHHRLITAIGDALTPQVVPRYYVRIEQRTYLALVEETERVARPDIAVIPTSGEPVPVPGAVVTTATMDVPKTVLLPRFDQIREGYLEIRDVRTHEVVTAIEVLSPTNKAPGEGRAEYEAKRRRILHSYSSLVEIDLLRGGQPMEMEPRPSTAYRIVVSPEWQRPRGRLYDFTLRDGIPKVSVPLRMKEEEPLLDLGVLLSGVYERARYDISLDYREPPPGPALSPEDEAWVDALLRERGLRT